MSNLIERRVNSPHFNISVNITSLKVLLFGDRISSSDGRSPFKKMEDKIVLSRGGIEEVYVLLEAGFDKNEVLKGSIDMSIHLRETKEGYKMEIFSNDEIKNVSQSLGRNGFNTEVVWKELGNEDDCSSIEIEDPKTSIDFWGDYILISHDFPPLIKEKMSEEEILRILGKEIEDFSKLLPYVLGALRDFDEKSPLNNL